MADSKQLLLLTAPPAGWDDDIDGGEVCPMGGWPAYKKIEACGEAHMQLVIKLINLRENNFEEEEEEEEEESIDANTQNQYSKKKKTSDMLELKKQEDYYALLGLGHLRWKATSHDIKAAYRKMILHYHPDKQAQGDEEVNDEVFKAISKAYEVLSNDEKRRSYDSQESFDDSIPSEEYAKDKDFFTVFGPTFERNSRFSVSPNPPSIGDLSTPFHQVKKFYDFWFSFKSWRDFSFTHEYDLAEAECREEKRWMERQNKKKSSKLKHDEHLRILKLTQTAYKLDPRIIKHQQEQEEERTRFKRERAEFRRKQKEEAEQQIALQNKIKEEQLLQKKLQEEEMKKAKAMENKAKRKKRQKLRAICKQLWDESNPDKSFSPEEDDVEFLCANLDLNDLTGLTNSFSKDAFESLIKKYRNTADPSGNKPASSPSNSNNNLSSANDKKEWTADEVQLLTKALSKFPVGTRNRWETITEHLNSIVKENRYTQKDIIAKSNELKLEKPVNTNQTANLSSLKKKKKHETAAEPTIVYNNATKDQNQIQPPTPNSPAKTPPSPTPSIDPSKWTPEMQSSLEKAMREFPGSLGDSRWDKIAEAIPPLTRQDVILRYKYLVAFFKQQQQQKK